METCTAFWTLTGKNHTLFARILRPISVFAFLLFRPTEENPVSQISEDHFYSFALDVCREKLILFF